MTILVTGATGFIGSHTCVELIEEGYDVIGIDSFVNSKPSVANRISSITSKNFKVYDGDVRDRHFLAKVFRDHNIDCVIHFAGLKAVGESILKPLEYYDNNLYSTITLCEIMNDYNCKKIIFSSSATVYGKPKKLPITESMELGITTNPYGETKAMNERILKDLYVSDNTWSICLLRYFNPTGGHKSGLLGEEPTGVPNNLMPYVVRVAAKELKILNVFGSDYTTKDGTGVRDYIHVVDLARGHVKALNKVKSENGIFTYNLGTGKGYSVLDIIRTFEQVNNIKVPYVMKPRREGDVDVCYADVNKAYKELGWKAENTLEDMCRDSWRSFLESKNIV